MINRIKYEQSGLTDWISEEKVPSGFYKIRSYLLVNEH